MEIEAGVALEAEDGEVLEALEAVVEALRSSYNPTDYLESSSPEALKTHSSPRTLCLENQSTTKNA